MMSRIKLKHPDAEHTVTVPALQQQHFQRMGWLPVDDEEGAKTPKPQPVEEQQNGKS